MKKSLYGDLKKSFHLWIYYSHTEVFRLVLRKNLKSVYANFLVLLGALWTPRSNSHKV